MKQLIKMIAFSLCFLCSVCLSADIDRLRPFDWSEQESDFVKVNIIKEQLLKYLVDSGLNNYEINEIRHKRLGCDDYWVIEARFIKLSDGPPEDITIYMDFQLKIYSEIEFKKILKVLQDRASPEKTGPGVDD